MIDMNGHGSRHNHKLQALEVLSCEKVTCVALVGVRSISGEMGRETQPEGTD